MDEIRSKKEAASRLSKEIASISKNIWIALANLSFVVNDIEDRIRRNEFFLGSKANEEILRHVRRMHSFYDRQLRHGYIGDLLWYELVKVLEKELGVRL
jgi:hypothetical protein